MGRKVFGRKKLELKKIAKDSSLQVTFSKRKSGIFNKACEISVMCGVDLLIVIFSPGGKPYIFGSPKVDAFLQNFLTGNPILQPFDPYTNRENSIDHLAAEYRMISLIFDKEKEYLNELNISLKDYGVVEYEGLNAHDLEVYLDNLKKLKENLISYFDFLTTN
ncbi:hypothetical protein ZOSMA_54G00230 [Zostera marina]|uniref:MADS-box domain-containing protein n=1 Tax=Zostera marina TaxID=29655 RepID=A0A0K9NWE6_ZOSMR|nr:hypothetical protein ZOSMA_54G00230 [Zostera marina]